MNSTTSINKRTVTGLIAAAFAAIMVFMSSASMATAAGKSEAAKAAKPGSATITSIVVGNPNFDILEAAVVSAGLDGVLDGNRQFTVFAPTDAAFVSSLEGVSNEAEAIDAVNSLPLDTLTDILLYHVTSGRKISTSVLAAPSQQMLNGDKLPIGELAAAGIVSTDLSASNGVVHVIDSVLGL